MSAIDELREDDATAKGFFIICYSATGALCVAEISRHMEYEVDHYRLASRRRFDTQEEAERHACTLALRYGLKLGRDIPLD